jgi:hypothetical protein
MWSFNDLSIQDQKGLVLRLFVTHAAPNLTVQLQYISCLLRLGI